jgi:porin
VIRVPRASRRPLAKRAPESAQQKRRSAGAALLLAAACWCLEGGSSLAEEPTSAPQAGNPKASSHLFNPAGDSLRRGTGELGRLLGLPKDSPVTLGGEWIGNGSSQMSGGWMGAYGRQSYAQAGFVDLRINLDKAKIWKGAEVWVQGLQYNVLNNGNNAAGSVQQFNNLISAPPFTRTELYTYGVRQKLWKDQVDISVGKLFAGLYFGAVARPIPDQNPAIAGGPNTNLLFLPPYSQPTFVGREPGYPDSTLGGVITIQPNALARRAYLSVGVFDGRTGVGPLGSVATGMQAGGDLLGPLLTMAETGGVWSLGAKQLPGSIAIGMWSQSGRLTTQCSVTPGKRDCPIENRATGAYAYAIQTLTTFKRGKQPGKLVGFLQGGATPSTTNMARSSLTAGLELVAPISGRPNDSFGVGASWANLNDSTAADWGFNPKELMFQLTGKFQVWGNIYAQPVVSWLPEVGFSQAKANSTVFTLQLSTSF